MMMLIGVHRHHLLVTIEILSCTRPQVRVRSMSRALRLLDEPDQLRRKVMRARTDTGTTVAYDPENAPGVSNLLDILAGCTGVAPVELATRFDRYGELKTAVADAVVDTLDPIRTRYLELRAEPDQVRKVLRVGAERARDLAGRTVHRAKSAIGLLPT